MRTNLSYRDFKCSRSRAGAEVLSFGSTQASLPLTIALWFVLSGMCAIDAATAAAVYGFSGLIPAALILLFVALSAVCFTCGSMQWPANQMNVAALEPSSDDINLTLNCALSLVAAGAALDVACIQGLMSWNNPSMHLLAAIVFAAIYLIGFRAAEGLWSYRFEAQQQATRLRDSRRRPARQSEASHFKPLLQALESAATEANNGELSASQSARARELVDQLMEQLNASISSSETRQVAAVPVLKREPVEPAGEVLELAITSDESIENALERTIGSLQRLTN